MTRTVSYVISHVDLLEPVILHRHCNRDLLVTTHDTQRFARLLLTVTRKLFGWDDLFIF